MAQSSLEAIGIAVFILGVLFAFVILVPDVEKDSR